MKIQIQGKLWNFQEDERGNEIGYFGEEGLQEVYVDAIHYSRLKDVFAKRQKHKWDNWVVYCGDEGDGKSTIAKQDCSIMASLCGGKFDVSQIAWDPEQFGKLIDDSKPGDSVLYDEGITGLDNQRSMSAVNHILKVKSTMCRKKRLYVAICIPSLFDLQKGIAVRRTIGMVKVYTDEVERGFYNYYNRTAKRILYVKGKQFEDMDAHKVGMPSRFTHWSMIDEKEYEQRKDLAHQKVEQEGSERQNKYKLQRDALILMLHKECGLSQTKIAELMPKYCSFPLEQTSISDINNNFKLNFAKVSRI